MRLISCIPLLRFCQDKNAGQVGNTIKLLFSLHRSSLKTFSMKTPAHPSIGNESPVKVLYLVLVPTAIAMNLAVSTVVQLLKIPLFIDAVGTITITLLLGIRAGIVSGITSFLVGGLLINPAMPYFVGTQLAIAIFVGLAARGGFFASVPKRLLVGIGLGIVAATASAPVIVALFGGFTGSGSGAITAFLVASGKSILKSVVLTGISCEPIDKTVQCLLAVWLIQGLPSFAKHRFVGHGYLERNHLL
jgi:energy-coupling factor transport system substrate-specific component